MYLLVFNSQTVALKREGKEGYIAGYEILYLLNWVILSVLIRMIYLIEKACITPNIIRKERDLLCLFSGIEFIVLLYFLL